MANFEFQMVSDQETYGQLQADWDALYEDAGQHQATARHAIVQAYLKTFGQDRPFEIACLREATARRLVAVLPLQTSRYLRWLTIAQNLANEWSPGLSGLLAADHDPADLVAGLMRGLAENGRTVLQLDWLSSESPFVQELRRLAACHKVLISSSSRFEVGKTMLAESWEVFTQDWSKKRRRFIRRATGQMQDLGEIRLICAHCQSAAEVREIWRQCVAIEAESWKGRAGTGIANHPAANDYFRQLVDTLHASGELRLYLLELAGRPIAYDLGYLHRRVATSLKVSYLPEFADYSPGHVLNSLVVQHMIDSGDVDWIDTVGELNDANAKWCSASYTCLKLELSLEGWLGRTLVGARDWMRTVKRQWSPDHSSASAAKKSN